jgi:predicted adenylyl cyclase CyaB
VESKFRCADHERVACLALDLGALDEGLLRQRDQFFAVPRGRLKLRTFADGGSELISYDRDNVTEMRSSDYALHRTSDGAALEEVLSRALPRRGILEKRRRLLIHRHTRIHLDDVVGLGRFIELETVIREQSDADAESEHDEIVHALGLSDAERIAVGYIDLLDQGEPIRT